MVDIEPAVDATPAPGRVILDVVDLHKAYGSVQAVRGISFQVHSGEVFGLLGPNGAGKTTTLECLEGMLPFDRGTVTVSGIDVRRQPERVRRQIGISLQKTAFFERLTLRELLDLFADLYGSPARPDELLERVGLHDLAKRQVKSLSGGQQQRFAVAVGLVNDPRLLFLDEPTTGLDPQARRGLWELVGGLRAEGRSVILTTHYMEEAQTLCDRVAILDHGQIVSLDTPTAMIRSLLDSGFLKPVVVQPATLEDVFLHLTGRTLREER
ncbi:MAG TPA: ABC transporter ATP-binding protein [Candidatus Limnocylindrales bacterium]|nr:ABC transporter ATP-binding protein [Candidatus Limnocylindrales bacterium]